MKNHPQTRRAAEIDRLVLARLARGRCSMADLVLGLRVSPSGVRGALLRLQERGAIVCGLDGVAEGFPRRVWTVTPETTDETTKGHARRRTPDASTDSLTASAAGVIR